MHARFEAISLDSTIMRAHLDTAGARKKGPKALGRSRGGWSTKLHLIAADDRTVVTCSLTPGQACDAPEGWRLISEMGPHCKRVALLIDSAYESNDMREVAHCMGLVPGWCRPIRSRASRGTTIRRSTAGAMGSNACSGA